MRKPRVLYIDDETEMVADLPAVLADRGFDIVGETDLERAQKLFSDSSFDVVLTDIAMPPSKDIDGKAVEYGRTTGIELVRRFHKLKPSVPIVALTVIREERLQMEMFKAGIKKILHKPQDVDPIVRTLKSVTGSLGT